jgi:hypothetical protein
MDRLAPYRELNWPLPPIWAVDGQLFPYRIGEELPTIRQMKMIGHRGAVARNRAPEPGYG